MEAILKIPLGDYLAPEDLQEFTRACAEKRVTMSARIGQLIRADIHHQDGANGETVDAEHEE